MLAAQICREIHLGVYAVRMQSRVPRCLFGSPNPKDTMELLQEALETERTRFAKRWGVDPLAEDEDKENGPHNRLTPIKSRSSPYSKQSCIHDYWRARKICDPCKKSSYSVEIVSTRQPAQAPSEPQPESVPETPQAPQAPQSDSDKSPSSKN